MKKLKFKKTWALDVPCMGKLIQLTSYKYKKDAVEESKKWEGAIIEKRILLTDKY